ncbi:MAG: rhomboid family intramembrane serine protease [Bacteroidetes bacterium]|nr:rhomboid family intramembrane serine protease [Bacteroidota bacterium]
MQYRLSDGTPPVVKNLLIINVLFFVATIVAQSKGIDLINLLGMHYPQSQFFRPWQILTHFFMHGGLTHIFFNMFALWMFGRMLEMVWGSKRFLFFYLVTAFSAALLHFLVVHYQIIQLTNSMDPSQVQEVINEGWKVIQMDKNFMDPSMAHLNGLYNGAVVGASGAVFGLLGACFILFPNMILMLIIPPIPIKMKYFVTIYGLIELFSGVANLPGDNIAHFAHLGGLIAGIIIVKYWNQTRRDSFF